MDCPTRRGDPGFRIIGGLKLASALLLGAAGFGIFRLLNKDLGEALEHVASRLHLDPESRLVHEAIYRLAGIDRAHLKAIGAGTFFYAFLETVEGVGLLLQRRWAEYLTIIATGLLLPLEVYEIARKANAVRVAVLLANLAILVYLILKLLQDRRARIERTLEPVPRT
ncbi:MAG TPA: DUF2127 domain-containing protein [Isosphaeraceae bacterium]|nr:DUF2127 domain-containing protein [Isosphaeraceae bacterium]